MDTKKIAATFAILMIALGVAGFAYAHWCETLTLNGTITTGIVDVEWSWDGELINGVKENGYVVATMEGTIEGNTLTVTINNTFPCLRGWFEIDVHNNGTIPVQACCDLSTFTISGDDLSPWINITDCWIGGEGSCEQIDPCQNVTLHVDFHFVQTALYDVPDAGIVAGQTIMPQNATMYITASLVFCNWNEPCPTR